ncbi:MAG: hypothetical protein JNL83_02105 [Myxococcales bacterium]|nr:hypothetical protein [Myxococcales bacterium]
MQAVAKHGTNIPAIGAELVSAGVTPSPQLAEELQRLLGNAGAMQVMSTLSEKKSEPDKSETEKPVEKPPVAQSSEVTSSEPSAKPQDKATPVPVPSAIAVSPGQTRPAYEVTYLAVKKTFEKLGFSVEGKGAKVVDLSAPKMTDTGFDFKTTTFSNTTAPEGERTTKFNFSDGLQKQVSQSALANSTEIAMNPIAEPTTLIHETVHRFQVGEIGTYLYEPVTELIAALAFEELAKDGAVTGAYTFAPDYLPWVLFTKNVLAPKLGWKRLVGYYVGQGFTDKDQLAVELGFAPNSPPHKQIMEALTSGLNLSDRIPTLTKLIKDGPSKPAEKPKGHHLPGPAIDGEDKTAPLDGVVGELEKRIAVDAKSGETLDQTAQRLKSENKTDVIQKMIVKAEEFLLEARANHPGLVDEIESTIEMLRNA